MKKQILTCALAAAICSCFAFAACTDGETETSWDGSTTTITCLDANAKETQKEVPLNPDRVAILDYAALDIMDALGVGDTVVATAEGTIAYLQSYWNKVDSKDIVNLGNLQSYDMELLQQSEPQIIFIGGRQSKNYAALEEIAPVVYLSVTAGDIVNGTKKVVETIGTIFGKSETEIESVLSKYDISNRVETLAALSKNEDGTAKTCLNIMYNSTSSFSALASDGRLSLIVSELGFTNSNESYADSQHGSSTSWEAIAETNPDYLFVMNRAYITANDGSTLEQAADSVRTAMKTELDKVNYSGTIVVLLNPDVWYTAEGGLQALDTMLSDLESALL